MKNILKTTILTLTLAVFVSCHNPLDRVYSPETISDDLQVLVAQDKIRTREEMENLCDYIQISEALGVSLKGKTYRQLLEAANDLEE